MNNKKYSIITQKLKNQEYIAAKIANVKIKRKVNLIISNPLIKIKYQYQKMFNQIMRLQMTKLNKIQ